MAVRAQKNRRRGVLLSVLVVLVAAPGGAQEASQAPTHTGLAELARGLKLKLPPGTRKLDNETVRRLGQDVATPTAQAAREGPAPAVKAWQARYQEARARVLGLELFLERARAQAYSPESPASAVLQRSIRRAETELEIMRGAPEQVVQQAVAAGGKREWFAGLPMPEPIFPSWVERAQSPATP